MAYEGAYQAQRPYPGPQQPHPGPGPYPPRQPRHDDYQGGPGYDYYDGYGPEYGDQYQDPGYARGPPLDQRSPPRSRSDYPDQPHLHDPGRGVPPMVGGRGGPGGPLQRAQTMEPSGAGPYAARGVPPPGPGRGYPNAPPGRGGPPGGYGRGPPPNMDFARGQGRPPMNGPMRSPVSDRFPGNGPQPYPPQDPRRGGYNDDAYLANKMAGMDVSQRPHMPMARHSGGSETAPHPGYGAANQYDRGPGPNGYGPGPAPPGGRGGGFGPPSRSVTMPINDAMGQRQPMPPPQRMDTTQNGPALQRPSTSHGHRPPPQRFYPNGSQGPPLPQGPPAQGAPRHAPQPSGASYDDIFDSYGGAPARFSNPDFNAMPPPPSDDDMPNFDNIPQHAPRASIDLHLTSGNPPPQLTPAPNRAYDMPRTKSQPDLRGQNAIYEMAGDAPPMPPMPVGQFGAGGPGRGMPMRKPSAPGLPGNPAALRANGVMTPNPVPPQAPDNPDALPSHPTPIRPGLMADSVVSVAKPPPMRNYSNASPAPMMQGGTAPTPAGAQSQPQDPVTVEELERLRAVFKSNSGDHETGLKFAKRLVEASENLVPNFPDPKSRSRVRDKYLIDAHKVLKKLANGSNRDAMFFYADCLGKGLFGHEPDNKEAFTLYQSAAKLGHAAAAYRTAVCCEIGHEDGGGTRRDPLKAMQWYKRSATLGDTPAMYKMGMIQLKGLLGQPRNPREAIGWLKRAADQADVDNPHSLHELGLLYESAGPDDVIIRDELYALSLFKRAAEMGYKFSQFRLGCAYEYGLMGCPVDPRLSIMWYSKAAMQKEHQAELALSGWYLTGSEGVLGQSDTEAYLWARKAAMAGLAKAEYAMGYFTEVGIGTTANMDDAKRWYWRAAAQDLTKARERLEDLKRSGKSGPRQRERISRSKTQQEGECSVM